MMQIINACTGEGCDKCNSCAKYILNYQKDHPQNIFYCENISYATQGSGKIYNDSNGKTVIEETWECGPNGNYRLFQPYVPNGKMLDLSTLTLGDYKKICEHHQRLGKDCETCDLCDFCLNQLTIGYPSGWKLVRDMA